MPRAFSVGTLHIADSRPEPGLRSLGAAVIRKAVEDAAAGSPVLRQQARHFLSDGETLAFWSTLAGLDPQAIREWSRR